MKKQPKGPAHRGQTNGSHANGAGRHRAPSRAIARHRAPAHNQPEEESPPQRAAASPAREATLKTQVVEVTPAIAKRWLERNHPDNRPVAFRRVESFANDMRDGHWKLTHQGIAFDAEGRLIDGQHRLHAVVQANVTVKMLVVSNAGEFGDPIDCGRPRSLAVLAKSSNKLVARINVLRMLEQGMRTLTPMTLAELQELAGYYEEEAQAMLAVPSQAKMQSGFAAACMWAMPIDQAKVVEFATSVMSGEMLQRGSPAHSFFLWRDAHKALDAWAMAQASLNAIRSHLADESLSSIYTTPSGYRGITQKRRAMKIPRTPGPDLVPTLGRTGLRDPHAGSPLDELEEDGA